MGQTRSIQKRDEIIEAVAKTVAELTSRQDGMFRQYLIDRLMREIMKFDGEFRREDAAGSVAPKTTLTVRFPASDCSRHPYRQILVANGPIGEQLGSDPTR